MGCISLENMTLSNFLLNNVKYMNNMFYDCRSLPGMFFRPNDTNFKFINTSNLVDMRNMLSGCTSLVNVELRFNTTNIGSYEGLFYNCSKLEYINIYYFTPNNLSDTNLTIFNDKYPSKGIIYINQDFYNRIISQIPSNSRKNIRFIDYPM